MFLHLLIISLACNGIYIATHNEGMILVKGARFMLRYMPEQINDPIFDCITCMSSFWTVLYAFAVWHPMLGYKLIFAIPAVAALNNFICSLIEYYGD